MTRKYTVSDKVKTRMLKATDLDRRLEIMRLRNQGWEFRQIAEKIGGSFQNANELYNKSFDMVYKYADPEFVENVYDESIEMTIEQLEKLRDEVQQG